MSDLSEYINYRIYNPYGVKFDVEVTEDERVIIKTDHWFVSLSSKKEEFLFFGYCLNYWDIDVIRDIRNKFGDIFSYLNHIRREEVLGKEFVSQAVRERDKELDSLSGPERDNFIKQRWAKDHKEKVKKSQKEWYERNKEKVKEYARNYYWSKKKKEKS